MTEVLPVKRTVINKIYLKSLQALLAAVLVCLIIATGTVAADTTWTQTTQADFTSGTLVQLDATSSPGDVKLAKVGSGYLYAFRGNGTKSFWRYDVSTNAWTPMADAPYSVGAGGALAFDGNNYIYALGGSGTKYFWRYDITANTWSTLSYTPSPVSAGGSLAFAGNYIYALRGQNKTNFWRYNIAGGTWSSMASTPSGVQGGGALAYGGGDFLYALKGGSTTSFWRYSISGNSWTSTLAGTPSVVGDGGSLAADGGNYVYALKGLNTVTYWRYDILADSWTAMADTPATPCVYGGGALAYDTDANFYALRGNNQDDFWKYSVSANSWSVKADTLSMVSYGGALVFQGAPYYTSGNLTSSAYDTGGASDFGNISWTAATPSGTAIKFQIATNNDSATWDFKGPDGTSGTYYTSSGAAIWSGHDSDRYIKYKAFFSTSDTGVTPVLNDISINYTPWVILPSVSTAAPTLVEETTTTLHGTVADDGGEACQYQFVYGTASGGPYTYSTGWTGSVTTGQSFSADVTGLSKGTKYYFVAQVKNSYGTGSGGELDFLTKPDPPFPFTANAISDTQIDLSWVKGDGAWKTIVRRNTGGYPADIYDGVQVYFDTGTSFSDTGLTPDTLYYYRAWSYVTGSEQWSDNYQDASAQTAPPPTTPPPTTTESPITIGGSVYPVNKLLVLIPWLCIAGVIMLVGGGVVFRMVRARVGRR
ncbi:MAG: hypothetical protein A2Y89_01260 [Chloroflexi bacterium RBG_13_51_18]|nr:MAG: hypothetical protein A2Y89_01260 [Chloroflexi bacterium RBG_13_51_18]